MGKYFDCSLSDIITEYSGVEAGTAPEAVQNKEPNDEGRGVAA
jgi:hypothetical protein